jgi:hypothetical protein
MQRAGFRLGIVGLGLVCALVSAFLFAIAAVLIERPPQRVGVHLEFPGEREAGEEFMVGVRRSVPRLLATAQAHSVKIVDVDAATLEVTFVPPQAWNESHGMRADGDAAPELVPDGLRTLLTTSRDLRVLEVVDMKGDGVVERDRTARMLDHHPERALDSLHAALHDANENGHTVAWVPRASGPGDLVPVLVEGSHDRQITILDLASAKCGPAATDIQLRFDPQRRRALEPYAAEINGRRVAFLVDGAIEDIGKVEPYRNDQLTITGEQREVTAEACAAIVAHVREPLSPLEPRITRSWITHKSSIPGAVLALLCGTGSALFVGLLVWALVRDVRRPRASRKEADWSSFA